MVLARWPHTVEWAVADDTAVWEFALTVAQGKVFPRTSESTHGDSIPATKTLKMAFAVIGRAGFKIVDSIRGFPKSCRRIDWIRVEDGRVENVI